MTRTVVGLFDTVEQANEAVRELMEGGLAPEHISLLTRDARGEIIRDPVGPDVTEDATMEGAARGATAGTVLGGALGLLVGLGALAIPGGGPVIAAGTLAATLGTTALGAGVGAGLGGLAGGLTNLGIHPSDIAYYTEGIRQGGVLVAATAENEARAQEAHHILHRHGGENVEGRIASAAQEADNRDEVPLLPRDAMHPDATRVAAEDEPPPPGTSEQEDEQARKRLL